MSLRKSPTLTPARIEANRRNAQKSTGPRTARGKAQSRMNGLQQGWASPVFQKLMWALMEAPPCSVDETVRAVLTPEQTAHPAFVRQIEIAREAEMGVAREWLEQQRRYPNRPFLRAAVLKQTKP